jgi:hypothetical protein
MNDNIPNSKIEYLISEWIHNARDRAILRRRLIDGIHFEPLAEEFDMSVRQIKLIVANGTTKIFTHTD